MTPHTPIHPVPVCSSSTGTVGRAAARRTAWVGARDWATTRRPPFRFATAPEA